MSENANSLWGSRFDGGPAESLAALSRSVHFDWRLAKYDIAGTRAHIRALHVAGYLTVAEVEKLDRDLLELLRRVEDGSFQAKLSDEDVHSALE
ncbi:MAG: argininosuccinate lyase, partial [Micrococcales bacterium]